MRKEDTAAKTASALRLAYDPGLLDPLVHRFRSVLRARPGLRILLLAEAPGEPHFLAQRLADEVGHKLETLDARRALRLDEADLRARLARIGRGRALLLIEAAEELLDRRGALRPATSRAGRNARLLVSALRRRRRPTLLLTTTSERSFAGLESLVDVLVAFGARRDGAEAELERPCVARNFRVEIAGREVACSEVSGLALPEEDAKLAGAAPTVLLRRALGPSRELFAWRESVVAGHDDRRDVVVRLLDAPGGTTVAAWRLRRAVAVNWTGPTLDALASGLALESLELGFEALEWL